MSSNEEDFNEGDSSHEPQNSKKRRIQRACDVCRRKKIRCDGVQMPGNRCSNCIAYNFDCTYVEAAKKRGPPKAYVESLETRLEKMEGLLHRLMPDVDLTKELGLGSNTTNRAQAQDQCGNGTTSTTEVAIKAIRKWDIHHESPQLQDTDEAERLELTDNLKNLRIDSREHRFFGKSSGAMLIKTAIDLKQEFTGRETDMKPINFGGFYPYWEDAISEASGPGYTFPDPDLLSELVQMYFKNVNVFFPLLHRPTFERSVREKLHYQDEMFGAILLLVCAVASRWVDDQRVLLDGVDSWHSCGWKYFDQVQVVRKSLLAPPTLYDLQFYCLSVQFLQGSSAPHSCWMMVGVGIRLAQDVGAHRRKPPKTWTVEDELWKRAFWVLVCMDRMFSTALGRPCAIQDEDYDLDLPLEVDDEYWEHPDPAMAFRQPPGKPSIISAFTTFIRLNVLLSMALRTIYAINKSKILMGFGGEQWEQHIVAELDSALNQWVDSVPDHLRWDPNRENEIFFHQSVMLYSHYYLVQILVHRPFIPSPKKPSPLSFPSLAICTNAARSASHIIRYSEKKRGYFTPISAFTAGIVLLLNIWGGKRSGLSTDPNKEMADVYKCMQALKASLRWHSAGRLWDILYELASVGELPLPNSSPEPTNKREWGAESPMSTSSISTPIPSRSRTIAGSKRAATATANADISSSSLSSAVAENPLLHDSPPGMQLFSLPMYSDELGRLPLHGQVNFSTRAQPNTQPQPMDWYNQPPPAPSGTEMGMNTPYIQPGYLNYDYPYGGSEAAQGTSSVGISASSTNGSMPYRNGLHPHQSLNGAGGPSSSVAGHSRHSHVRPPPDQAGMLSSRDRNPNMNDVDMPPSLDSDTFAMWSNAPSGFELDDWGTYLNNVSELTQTMNRGHGSV
ncbi:hypothetical protein BT96DRAFT_957454 [Gymnopus androsaceus JB14]|uniref:Zn(2)-C6 fungal-type domain-containing protein n=1 Tax=Gymnopus androsaceus JB14 TaxID=1447944 RepID=A0A6A4HPE3_9AGAR|nr:hypothetical protein BT96DRAFT_957454 [Gymnopus androsaceus JB14]